METANANPHIGLVGVGRMGAPIARRLIERYSVSVSDTNAARDGVVPDAAWVNSARDLAATSDIFITVLPGPTELRECLAEALPALRRGSLWLDLTSGDPAATRELAAQATRRGVQPVSAPMGGSVAEAKTGELIFYASGADEAVQRARLILEMLARADGVRRAGTRAEDGQIVKLLANALWFANAVAASEAMLVGQGLGLGVDDLHGLLRQSAGGSRFLDEHLSRLLGGDYMASFGIDRVVEELDTVETMSRAADVTTPILDSSARLHRAALDRFGPVLGELLAVKLLESDAGRQLRS
ncbi:NAD(P)-dependent oxidoreductase [Microbacterium sp. NPDC088619]|uniref:NAD(P)-dependent oxidoreductase n=1 Tax=Microbacterium sp. NPDC088619 TaxID=3364196 RepID=UPI00380B29AA